MTASLPVIRLRKKHVSLSISWLLLLVKTSYEHFYLLPKNLTPQIQRRVINFRPVWTLIVILKLLSFMPTIEFYTDETMGIKMVAK